MLPLAIIAACVALLALVQEATIRRVIAADARRCLR
jgi:hypothetical protein